MDQCSLPTNSRGESWETGPCVRGGKTEWRYEGPRDNKHDVRKTGRLQRGVKNAHR